MTNAEARFNKSLRPRKPEGSLGQTAQDVHLDSHTAPELCPPSATDTDNMPRPTRLLPGVIFNLKQSEGQSARAGSTNKGANLRSNYLTQVRQQRSESPTVTLTWHACK